MTKKRKNKKMSKQSFNYKEYVKRLKLFPVVVLVLAIIILSFVIFLNSNVIYGNSLLVLIGFIFLITLPSIFIAIITVCQFPQEVGRGLYFGLELVQSYSDYQLFSVLYF